MKMLRFAALGVAATLALTACSSADTPSDDATTAGGDKTPEAAEITLWLAGGDTNKDLRQYLKDTFAAENPGSTLNIEEIAWPDLVTKLTTRCPTRRTRRTSSRSATRSRRPSRPWVRSVT